MTALVARGEDRHWKKVSRFSDLGRHLHDVLSKGFGTPVEIIISAPY